MAFDRSFLSTPHFLVSAILAAAVMGGAAASYLLLDGPSDVGFEGGCSLRSLPGAPIFMPPATVAGEGERRTLSWTLDAAAYRAGDALACVRVGEVLVEASPDASVHLQARIVGDTAEAAAATEVVVAFADQDGRLHVAVHEARSGVSRGLFGDDESTVTLVLRLPEAGPWDVEAAAGVGDVRVGRMLAGNLTLATDVGAIRALEMDLTGDASARAGVGSVILAPASVQEGRLAASSDVDDVEVRLPARPDVGYAVTAQADVGDVEVGIGETESLERTQEGAGARVEARTKGYADKPVKVTVEAVSGVGDVRVLAAAP